jgi:hypothetical protein
MLISHFEKLLNNLMSPLDLPKKYTTLDSMMALSSLDNSCFFTFFVLLEDFDDDDFDAVPPFLVDMTLYISHDINIILSLRSVAAQRAAWRPAGAPLVSWLSINGRL